jgi:hypothetical protein
MRVSNDGRSFLLLGKNRSSSQGVEIVRSILRCHVKKNVPEYENI